MGSIVVWCGVVWWGGERCDRMKRDMVWWEEVWCHGVGGILRGEEGFGVLGAEG